MTAHENHPSGAKFRVLHFTPQCPDCGVAVGEPHHYDEYDGGCDIARCLVTGLQRLMCDGDHERGRDVWTGVVAEPARLRTARVDDRPRDTGPQPPLHRGNLGHRTVHLGENDLRSPRGLVTTGRQRQPFVRTTTDALRFDTALFNSIVDGVIVSGSHCDEFLEDNLMAQQVVVAMVDDIDGSVASQTVPFSLDGVSFEIDLSDDNAKILREELDRYVEAARRTGGRRIRLALGESAATGGASTSGNDRELARRIREWANGNGYVVSDRGRIPGDVRTAFEEAERTATDTTEPVRTTRKRTTVKKKAAAARR
jgi:hypothetical protein